MSRHKVETKNILKRKSWRDNGIIDLEKALDNSKIEKNDVLQLCLFTLDESINNAVFKYKDKMTLKCLVPY